MTSSRWSSLLLGTILATTAFGQALGEEPAPPVPAPAQQVSVGSTPDLLIDPAVLAAATIDAVRAGDAVTEEMLDRIMTGSIVPLTSGPR
ncbi:MAG: hypothetical protein OEL76_16590, partial [Siculibacillus sp.]|nr:hypothetical protein [Siculibacillus sp.]